MPLSISYCTNTFGCVYICGLHSVWFDLTEIVECCWTRLRSLSRLCFRSWTGAVTPSPSLPPFPRPVRGKAWSSGRCVWQISNGVSQSGAGLSAAHWCFYSQKNKDARSEEQCEKLAYKCVFHFAVFQDFSMFYPSSLRRAMSQQSSS